MYKVNLRIEKVFLRFKNNAVIQTLIRKGQDYFVQPNKIILNNQMAVVDNISQFFVDSSTPTFTIQVIVSFGGAHKLAGQVTINLHERVKSVLYNSVEKLQKSPDENATIQINLFYEKGPNFIFDKKLLTFRELFGELSDRIFQSSKQQTLNLQSQNSRLSNLVDIMKQQNQHLMRNNQQTVKKFALFAQKMNISLPFDLFQQNLSIETPKQSERIEDGVKLNSIAQLCLKNLNQNLQSKNFLDNSMTQQRDQ